MTAEESENSKSVERQVTRTFCAQPFVQQLETCRWNLFIDSILFLTSTKRLFCHLQPKIKPIFAPFSSAT